MKKRSKSKAGQVYRQMTAAALLSKSHTEEEHNVILMYRHLSRWEKNAVFLLLNSLAWGRLNAEATDGMEWKKLSRGMGLSKAAARRAAEKSTV